MIHIRISLTILGSLGCLASVAFANAFTKVFLDSDDTRSLNRAYKTLNEHFNKLNGRSSTEKRLIDSDYKDLAFIKWTKSAINLHNNHVGRQVRFSHSLQLYFPIPPFINNQH